jgi:DNA-binding PadR family transcriptional regulator
MPDVPTRQNLWELAVLAFLAEKPMHPYEMQRLLVERHKAELLTLKRGSLYHAINRLLDLAVIEPLGTGRAGKRPPRTTYRITPAGQAALTQWIQAMLSTPIQESSEFMAALSFLVHLTPEDAIPWLEQRVRWLKQKGAAIDSSLELLVPRVKRINLIESEYLSAMHKAEIAWIKNLVHELRGGNFTWDLQTILRDAEAAQHGQSKPGKGT